MMDELKRENDDLKEELVTSCPGGNSVELRAMEQEVVRSQQIIKQFHDTIEMQQLHIVDLERELLEATKADPASELKQRIRDQRSELGKVEKELKAKQKEFTKKLSMKDETIAFLQKELTKVKFLLIFFVVNPDRILHGLTFSSTNL